MKNDWLYTFTPYGDRKMKFYETFNIKLKYTKTDDNDDQAYYPSTYQTLKFVWNGKKIAFRQVLESIIW